MMKDDFRLLRVNEVQNKTSLTRNQIYRLMAEGKFPKPLHISERGRAWRSDEIDDWIESRSNARARCDKVA